MDKRLSPKGVNIMKSDSKDYLDNLDVNIVNIKNLFTTILRITEDPLNQKSGEEIQTIALAGISFVYACEEASQSARFG